MPYYDQYGPNFDGSGGNAARDYAQASQGSDFQRRPPGDPVSFLKGLLAARQGTGQPTTPPGSIQSQPLPPPDGSQASAPGSPFGGSSPQQAPQPASQAKPATQLSSADAIMDKVKAMLSNPDFSALLPSTYNSSAGQTQPDWMAIMSALTGGQNGSQGGAQGQNTWMPGYTGNPFSAPRQRVVMHANGGYNVPGFMRGGYPELYNAPVRHFDSGGENYVGQQYGDSGGRADDVNAKLSPREYVMDAESMALLGDGNPDDGAKKMDQMRADLRKHKGKALAKGKISPDAKPAMSYVRDPKSMTARR